MRDFIVHRKAPRSRQRFHEGDHEACFHEASVMLAFAIHLLAQGARAVEVHPDGMHAKTHDIPATLRSCGFRPELGQSATRAARYIRRGRRITISMRSGVGDVVAALGGRNVVAECKGGIVNTQHPGQRSRLRKGLCEAVGQLIGRERENRERHIAVVPDTAITRILAKRMAPRAARAGIELALVRPNGRVDYIT